MKNLALTSLVFMSLSSFNLSAQAADENSCPQLSGVYKRIYNVNNPDSGYELITLKQEVSIPENPQGIEAGVSIFKVDYSNSDNFSALPHMVLIANKKQDPNPAQGFYSYCESNTLIALLGAQDAPGTRYSIADKKLIVEQGKVIDNTFVVNTGDPHATEIYTEVPENTPAPGFLKKLFGLF